MATQQINRIIEKLDWKAVEAALFNTERADSDPGFEVCEASLETWERYDKSEYQALKSRAMTFEGGKLYIVELPSGIHEVFLGLLDFAVLTATGTGTQHLQSCRSTYVESLRKLEPDCSFGPTFGVGAVCPTGMTWSEYHTLKVEVGISRGWPCLDRKADRWREYPGVEFILCIRLSRTLRIRQYKLYTMDNRANPLPQMNPVAIINPTDITFNSRRLLGLVGRRRIPPGFSRPNVVLDLILLIEILMQRIQ
ncbi:uncharacterized protein PHALS_08042 [Plasmopara halstedii]|uniref:Uncharacterized protein n=1 Tax=Plasmopara halstedii TaxID=4781 RepID=A0A0N7L8M9_PLAHL|nr:uncharacterized protein PHALS_08042 [Plasmopara halstedii]CEG50323.1 hypothetical protein PHALS_08042 [Plasmopara halstedii]|eukprot:XP_024586692.1 hypothetical protein PHALS_08042 [Plasmopara halstedii]